MLTKTSSRRSSSSSSRVPRVSGVVLTETSPACITVQRFLALLPLKAYKCRRLVGALFQCPITYRTETQVFGERVTRSIIYEINKLSRAEFGKNAIIREPLYEDERGTNFSVLKLNPELFDTPNEYKLRPSTDVTLADILPAAAYLVLIKLADTNFCTKDALIAAGVPVHRVVKYLATGGINQYFRRIKDKLTVKLPDPIKSTSTGPYLYSVDRRTAKAFDITLTRTAPSLTEAFSEDDLTAINLLAAFNKLSIAEFREKLGISHANRLARMINRINSRCREFGWPPAIITEGSTPYSRTCRINPKFLKVHAIQPKRKMVLSSYFTRYQTDIINYIVSHPFRNISEIARGLNTSQKSLYEVLDAIEEKCGKLTAEIEMKTPLLIRFRRHNSLYAFSQEFCNIFELTHVKPRPLDVIRAKVQRKVYSYLTSPRARRKSNKDAAKALRLDERQLSSIKIVINNALAVAGLRPISSGIRNGIPINKIT